MAKIIDKEMKSKLALIPGGSDILIKYNNVDIKNDIHPIKPVVCTDGFKTIYDELINCTMYYPCSIKPVIIYGGKNIKVQVIDWQIIRALIDIGGLDSQYSGVCQGIAAKYLDKFVEQVIAGKATKLEWSTFSEPDMPSTAESLFNYLNKIVCKHRKISWTANSEKKVSSAAVKIDGSKAGLLAQLGAISNGGDE